MKWGETCPSTSVPRGTGTDRHGDIAPILKGVMYVIVRTEPPSDDCRATKEAF